MDNMFGSDDGNAAGTNDNTAHASEAPEQGGEGGEEGEAAYVPATESSAARIPSFKKRRGSGEDEGDDDEERQRRKKQKKDARAERRARAAAEEEDEGEDEPQLDEATRRRLALEERIDAVGKTNRAPRRKKKGDDIDVSFYDV
jgi:transcription factor SPN1